jgi:hypothetical protein
MCLLLVTLWLLGAKEMSHLYGVGVVWYGEVWCVRVVYLDYCQADTSTLGRGACISFHFISFCSTSIDVLPAPTHNSITRIADTGIIYQI